MSAGKIAEVSRLRRTVTSAAVFLPTISSVAAEAGPELPERARAVAAPGCFIGNVEGDADAGPVAAIVAASTGGEIRHVYRHAVRGFR